MTNDKIPNIVKVSVVATAIPRWIVAMLAGEGLLIPPEWKHAWIVISAILAATMAVCEGIAFAYLFSAWKRSSGKPAKVMLGLSIATSLTFVGVLAPSMAASVREVTLNEYLHGETLLVLWTSCVALSTMLVVVSIGYAQKEDKSSSVDPELSKLRLELREVKKELTQVSNERNEVQSKLGTLSGLLSSVKKDRIHTAHKLWGNKLPQNAIAVICDATETQVSTEFKILNNGHKKVEEKIYE